MPTRVAVAANITQTTSALQGSGRHAFRLGLLAMAIGVAYDASAQLAPGAEEIIIVQSRSRNRLENQQDVPISLSLVAGEEIDRLLANDISSIVLRTANISWNQGNQRTSSLSIRGIGKQGQTEAQDPSVGVIVDGVSYAYNALTSSFDFYDVDTVEVIRGPQGTLLGKNASLGVVNVTTKRPQFTPSADYQLSMGERDTVIGRAAIGGAIVDDLLAWRGSFTTQKGKGVLVNRYNPDLTYTNKDRISGRIQFLLTPSDNFSARLAVDATPRAGEFTNSRTINLPRPPTFANGVPNTSLENQDRLNRPYFTQHSEYTVEENYLYGGGGLFVENDAARPLTTGSNGTSLELNWDNLGPFSLTSITAYKDYHFNAVNDEGTPFDVSRNSGGFWNDYKQVTQEIRLSSDVSELVDYQTGLYYIKVDNDADYRRIDGNDAGAWFASNAQYGRLDVAVNPDGSTSGGRYLLRNSLSGLKTSFNSPAGVQDIQNESIAAFAQANWHLSDAFTITTGIRLTREERRNVTWSGITDNGAAPELNPAEVNGVQLGGFNANVGTGALSGPNSVAQLSLADLVATKYFGIPATNVPGAAYALLTAAQQRQVADARQIRLGRIGVIFNQIPAEAFQDTQPAFVISPSYRLNEDTNTYVSWQYGEKAGIAQNTNGVSNLIAGEENNAFEVGIKSSGFLNGTLVLNADLFFTDIKNYQQSVRVVDEYTTARNIEAGIEPATAYTGATGNVPRVKAQGLEIDGVYGGLPYTRLRFAFAYTDAYYDDFPNSAQPSEQAYPGAAPYRDISGETLPGTSKLSGNLGVDFSYPLAGDKELKFDANIAFNSKYNSDNALSVYGTIPGKGLVDASIGYGRADGTFGFSVIAKNLFDNETPTSRSWNSYTVAEPRWVGVMVTGSF